MRAMPLQVLPVLLLVVAGGCLRRGPAPPAQNPREQAIIKAVSDFKQELVALSTQYRDLADIDSFPHTELGFTYVNNAIDPRVHIAVSVEDLPAGVSPVKAVGAERIAGTNFETALQLECADAELKKKIEDAYSHLKDRLKTVK